MKIRITDFIIAMGEICETYNGKEPPYCNGCPFHRNIGHFVGCIRDKQSNPEFAEIIREETIKFMKKKEDDKNATIGSITTNNLDNTKRYFISDEYPGWLLAKFDDKKEDED